MRSCLACVMQTLELMQQQQDGQQEEIRQGPCPSNVWLTMPQLHEVIGKHVWISTSLGSKRLHIVYTRICS